MKPVLIQPLAREFEREARTLILDGLEEHWGSLDPEQNPDLEDISASYASGIFLVALLNGHVVGTGALLPGAAGTARIVRMSVAAGMRRRGIASRILKELVRQAEARGFRRVVLETTSTWQDAVAFYRNAGFRVTDIRDGNTWFALNLAAQKKRHGGLHGDTP